MKKRYIFFLLIIISLPWGEGRGGVFAQQIGMYSHYFYKPMVYNPAFAGSDDAPNAMLVSRAQWTNFKGAPQLTLFTADGNILDKKVGLGLSLISDRKGITNKIGGTFYYAYHLKLNDDMHLSLGASLSVADQSIDFSRALVETPTDPTLYADAQHKTAFDASAGLVFSWKDLKIGAGVPQLIGNKLKSVNYVDSSNVHAYYTQVRHYMISAQYKYFILKDKGISVNPLVLVRFVPGSPFQFDGTVNFDWQDRLWVGATYKSSYAVAANLGFALHKQLSVGYSYDVILGNLGKYAGIAHEIMVNFKFAKNKKTETISIPDKPTETENTDYDEKLDKLQTQLKKNQAKLKELSDRLDKQAANAEKPIVTTDGKPGSVSSDGVFVTNKNDFKDSKGQTAESGYYVIVGIFFYRDFAEEEIKNFVKKGFSSSALIYSESKKNNYVFVYKVGTKEEAFEKAKELNAKDSSNAWILNLTD
jgi:type IX secretion system PorP/SprF family membrane protein